MCLRLGSPAPPKAPKALYDLSKPERRQAWRYPRSNLCRTHSDEVSSRPGRAVYQTLTNMQQPLDAIRQMHAEPARPWTMAQLASAAALSRSAFSERLARHVGVPPMEYLLRWRMARAADLRTRDEGDIADVAARVGYGSASTFGTAFRRHFGLSPGRYARIHTPAPSIGPAQAARERMERGAVAGRA